ncbi:MAG: alpha-galactosidase [Pirellulales bacterium]|nr:alpha-galactosidase [Pirellulales bacterium]
MITTWMRVAPVVLVFLCTGASLADEDFRLMTEDTALVMRHSGGRIGCVRFGPADSSWNWIRGVEHFEPVLPRIVGNQRQPIAWQLASVRRDRDDTGETVTALFSADSPSLQLRVVWKAYPGPGPIEQTLALVNSSPENVTVGAMPSLSWRLQAAPDADLVHQWVEKGASKPPKAGTHFTPIGANFRHRGVSSPQANKKNSGEAIPWQCVHDRVHRHGWYTAIASSAHVAQQVKAIDGQTLRVTLGFDEKVSPFTTVVRPGGRVSFPPVLLGCYQGSIDDGCNRFHRWAERWYLPSTSDNRLPLVNYNSWGREYDIDEDICRKMIDDAAAMGFEMFHIDAGWFRAVGDWRPDPKKFPHGMRSVSDYAHGKGLKFGLWVAWTQGGKVAGGGPNVLSVVEPKMRSWFPPEALTSKKPKPIWRGVPCCLGSPAARQWCLEQLREIIRRDKLDMLEHDQTMIISKCTSGNHDHTSSQVDAGRSAAEGYYEIHDTLRGEFPDLLLENCVGGGCTVDFGIMRRCHFVDIVESYDPLSNRKAFYDASFPLPPRSLEVYVADKRSVATVETFVNMLRSGMLGWCTLMIDTTRWNSEERKAARRQIEIYKRHLRPLIREGNFYHVSSRPTENGWDAFQYHDPKQGTGAVLVFRAKSPSAQEVFKLDGLKPDAVYTLRFEDYGVSKTVATGRSLMQRGLFIHLPSQETSQVVYLEEQRQQSPGQQQRKSKGNSV